MGEVRHLSQPTHANLRLARTVMRHADHCHPTVVLAARDLLMTFGTPTDVELAEMAFGGREQFRLHERAAGRFKNVYFPGWAMLYLGFLVLLFALALWITTVGGANAA